jgi:cell division protein ZapA (FtsZ GTPase activity inhibitor)
MKSIEVAIGKQKFVVSGDETEEHLHEVTELVRRKVESIRKLDPSMSLQRATMLAAFDFASETIKGKKRAANFRTAVLSKAQEILERVQTDLSGKPGLQ